MRGPWKALGALGALCALDRFLLSWGLSTPDSWLAAAVAPVVIGATLMGAIWGRSGRMAVITASGSYAAAAIIGGHLSATGHLRTELLAVVPAAALAAHGGVLASLGVRVARARSAVQRVLFSEELPARAPGSEDLSLLGLKDNAPSESGLLSALVAVQRARERQTWATFLAVGCGLLLVGYTLPYDTASWAGLIVLAAAVVVGSAWLLGVGRGPTAYDSLISGNFDRAVVEFTRALSRMPADTLARVGLGIGQLHLGRHENAAAEFLTARFSGPHEVPIAVWLGVERMLGVALREAGQGEQARRSFERLLALFPNHPGTMCDLGLALDCLGERRAAAQVLRRAVARGSEEARHILRQIESASAPERSE